MNGIENEENNEELPEVPIPETNEPAPSPVTASELTSPAPGSDEETDADLKKLVRRKTIQSFLWFSIAMAIFLAGFIWLLSLPGEKDPEDNLTDVSKPFRKVLGFNEWINSYFFSERHLAPEYPESRAVKSPRINGDIGMDDDFDTSTWVLQVVNIDRNDTLILDMNDIKKLPKTEVVFNFKCIEGWSQVTHWGGVRFIDFIKYYKLGTHSGKPIDRKQPEDMAKYTGLETPEGAYYVGLDMQSAIHPQTILCYEMNGKPLPVDQGAPLRLIIPVKYGVKSIKRIGLIYFSDDRPRDYWFEQGYDYDAAL